MRILIVEDEPKTGDYLKQGLLEAGFVVDLARDGIDVAVRSGMPVSDGLVARPIGEHSRALYAAPSYAARGPCSASSTHHCPAPSR